MHNGGGSAKTYYMGIILEKFLSESRKLILKH
jgi:hypothetical protein